MGKFISDTVSKAWLQVFKRKFPGLQRDINVSLAVERIGNWVSFIARQCHN